MGNDSVKLSDIQQAVLGSYMENHKTILQQPGIPSRLKFEDVVNALGYTSVQKDFLKRTMIDDNYLQRNEMTSDGEPMLVTDKARKEWPEGGYKKEEFKIELERKNLFYETRNYEWNYKMRWWPLIISILAFIISIVALFK